MDAVDWLHHPPTHSPSSTPTQPNTKTVRRVGGGRASQGGGRDRGARAGRCVSLPLVARLCVSVSSPFCGALGIFVHFDRPNHSPPPTNPTKTPNPKKQQQLKTDGRRIFRMVLRALEMPLGLLFLAGQWHGWKTPDGNNKGAARGFSSLPFPARERVMRALLTSPIAPTRGVRVFVVCVCALLMFAGGKGRMMEESDQSDQSNFCVSLNPLFPPSAPLSLPTNTHPHSSPS